MTKVYLILVLFLAISYHPVWSESICLTDDFENGESEFLVNKCSSVEAGFRVQYYVPGDGITEPEGSTKYLTTIRGLTNCLRSDFFPSDHTYTISLSMVAYYKGQGIAPSCRLAVMDLDGFTLGWNRTTLGNSASMTSFTIDTRIYRTSQIEFDCEPQDADAVFAIDKIQIIDPTNSNCEGWFVTGTSTSSTSEFFQNDNKEFLV